MTEQKDSEPSHEVITSVKFGDVLLVPYDQDEKPRRAIVVQQVSLDGAITHDIVTDADGREWVAMMSGGSNLPTAKRSPESAWTADQIVDGICAVPEFPFSREVVAAMIAKYQ